MIYVDGQLSPTHKHFNYQDALREAKRLSKLTNMKAYILVTFQSVEINDYKIEDLTSISNELPF